MNGYTNADRERVLESVAQGATGYAIAKRTGIPIATIYRWINPTHAQKSRAASLEAKRRRRGTCERCGAETRYNGHTGAVSRLCRPCTDTVQGLARRGDGPIIGAALAILREGKPVRYKDLRNRLDISHDYAAQLLYGRLIPFGFARRVRRGVYVAGPALKDEEAA